jgi:tetratricopeptide (TPR) repeat protein
MKRVFPIILTILLLMACMENRSVRLAMEQAAALMDTRPDSALGLLLNITTKDSASMTEGQRMRWLLLRQQGMNKCDTVFRSDSIPLLLVEWFDRHGTPNEQVLAHYLLGRAYADMGESPAALQAYLEAVAKADTTMADADFGLLSRVYSQMASIYRRKALRYEDLEALEKAEQYSLKDKDTVTAHIYSNIRADTYYLMGVTDTAMAIREKEIRYFTEKGRNDVVAIMKGASVSALLSLGQTEKARRYLAVSEDSSGFVNPDGTAVHGHEIYYYNKGMYYMAVHKPDSAEIYFRRLQRDGLNLNDHIAACEGLARVYEARGRNDSVAKYLRLSGQLNDSAYSRAEADGMLQMKAEYDYTRSVMQAQASQVKKERAEKRLAILLTGFLVLLAVLALLFWKIRRRLKNKKAELSAMRDMYLADRRELDTTLKQLSSLEKKYEETTRAYQEQVGMMSHDLENKKRSLALKNDKMKELRGQLHSRESSIRDLQRALGDMETEIEEKKALAALMHRRIEQYEAAQPVAAPVFNNVFSTDIYAKVCRAVEHPSDSLTDDEWQQLHAAMEAENPTLRTLLRNKFRLSDEEYDICLLLLLDFTPSAIANIMMRNYAFIAKKRRSLMKKVFRTDGRPQDFDDRLRERFKNEKLATK